MDGIIKWFWSQPDVETPFDAAVCAGYGLTPCCSGEVCCLDQPILFVGNVTSNEYEGVYYRAVKTD